MHLFYTAAIEPQHKDFILCEDESKHAIRVLRLVTGDIVGLVDGRGGWYTAEIIDPHPKRTVLKILTVKESFNKLNYDLHIAIAPTKSIDRIEWFLEKATEVGISEITPLLVEHSERKEVKLDRLNKVVVSAMKQSLKAYLPKINPLISFSDFLVQQETTSAVKVITHCAEGEKKFLNKVCPAGGKYLVLIGPEGDFSTAEVSKALAMGYLPVSLGESRLRTETAALASCIELSLVNRS